MQLPRKKATGSDVVGKFPLAKVGGGSTDFASVLQGLLPPEEERGLRCEMCDCVLRAVGRSELFVS